MLYTLDPFISSGIKKARKVETRAAIEESFLERLVEDPFKPEAWRELDESYFEKLKKDLKLKTNSYEDLKIKRKPGKSEKIKRAFGRLKETAGKYMKAVVFISLPFIASAASWYLIDSLGSGKINALKQQISGSESQAAFYLNKSVSLEAQINQSLITASNFLTENTYSIVNIGEISPNSLDFLLVNPENGKMMKLIVNGTYVDKSEIESMKFSTTFWTDTASEAKLVLLPQRRGYYSICILTPAGPTKELGGAVKYHHDGNSTAIEILLDPNSETYLNHGNLTSLEDITEKIQEIRSFHNITAQYLLNTDRYLDFLVWKNITAGLSRDQTAYFKSFQYDLKKEYYALRVAQRKNLNATEPKSYTNLTATDVARILENGYRKAEEHRTSFLHYISERSRAEALRNYVLPQYEKEHMATAVSISLFAFLLTVFGELLYLEQFG